MSFWQVASPREEYFPYGSASDRRDARNRYRFIGVERDEDTGLCMTGPRTYDPVVGCFLQGDPALSPAATPYAYASASPAARSDASGYQDVIANAESDRPPSYWLSHENYRIDPRAPDPGPSTHPVGVLDPIFLPLERPLQHWVDLNLQYNPLTAGTLGAMERLGVFEALHSTPALALQDVGVFKLAAAFRPSTATLRAFALDDVGGTGFGARKLVAGEAGRFGDLAARGVVGDAITPHHIPQAALGFTSRVEGGALAMRWEEHVLTRTYGVRGAGTARSEAGLPFRDVLARDIRDVRRIVGTEYNQGLLDLIEYYRGNFPHLMSKPR